MKTQIIDILAEHIRSAGRYNSAVQTAPAAILWTDEERQWQAAMPVIKQAMPELIELGDYNPQNRTGPAIWIKCAIAGLADELDLAEQVIPIVYLPGVCRKDLRAIEDCPPYLQPLAELQYRGCWWAYNSTGRDWSVTAFLTNEHIGLQLDIARDQPTQEAMHTVLAELLETQVEHLQGRRLEANDFHALVVADPVKDLLGWLNAPLTKQAQWPENKWAIFCEQCQQQYGFDPQQGVPGRILSELCAAEREWEPVWQRFVDTAHNLPDLMKQLTTVRPLSLVDESSHFLSINLDKERELEIQLVKLAEQDASTIQNTLRQLEQEHGKRRDWLWQRLGFSPWANILQALNKVTAHTIDFSGAEPQVMADAYQERFWQADAAALQAMEQAQESQQQQIVADILAVIYTPWLERTTLQFQQLVKQRGYPGNGTVADDKGAYQPKSQIVLFVDGLRYDTAQRLLQKLHATQQAKTTLKTHWSALPSLTATAKAAVTPIADLLTGSQDNNSFLPVLDIQDKELSSHHFRKALEQRGWQFLEGLETGDPQGWAWVQMGDLDHLGHEQQQKLPLFIDRVLTEVTERVKGLLEAGWQHIRIVTDHGWLWAPHKLPKADIAKNATRNRLARCAILKDNVQTEHLKMHWHWNRNVTIAMAPGICEFEAGDHYNHGGVSLQECLVPVIEVGASTV